MDKQLVQDLKAAIREIPDWPKKGILFYDVTTLLKQGRYQIIIDLGNVDYISSAGWGIFISEIKSIHSCCILPQ